MTENIKSYYALRRDLMEQADMWNKKRLELVELQRKLSEDITRLVEASEKLFTKSLDELDGNGELRKEYKTETDVQAVADYIKPGRRCCSLCGKPGHRAPTCPDAHTVREQDKAAKAAGKPEKKKRKPVSEERRAQLREQLKKARASRGKR